MSRIDLVMTKKRLVDALFQDYTSRPMINFLWEKKRKDGWLTRDDFFQDIMDLKEILEEQQLYLHDQIYFKEHEEARYTLILNTNDEVVGVMDLVRDIIIIKKKMSGSSAPMETNRDGEARGSDRFDQASRFLQRRVLTSFETTINRLIYASNQKTFEEQNAIIESWLKVQDKSIVGKFEKYYTVDYGNERAVMESQAKQIVEKDGAKVRFSVYPGSLYDEQGKQGYFVVSPDKFSQHKMYYAVPIEPPKMNEEPDRISETSESSEFSSMDDIPEPALRTPPKAPKKEKRISPKPNLDKYFISFSSEEEEENFPPRTEGLALRVSALTFF